MDYKLVVSVAMEYLSSRDAFSTHELWVTDTPSSKQQFDTQERGGKSTHYQRHAKCNATTTILDIIETALPT